MRFDGSISRPPLIRLGPGCVLNEIVVSPLKSAEWEIRGRLSDIRPNWRRPRSIRMTFASNRPLPVIVILTFVPRNDAA